MDGDNGHKGEGEQRKKRCPFLDQWCLGDACAIYTEGMRQVGGITQKTGVCGFNALGMILSEINAKTMPPQPQKITIPSGLNQFRG